MARPRRRSRPAATSSAGAAAAPASGRPPLQQRLAVAALQLLCVHHRGAAVGALEGHRAQLLGGDLHGATRKAAMAAGIARATAPAAQPASPIGCGAGRAGKRRARGGPLVLPRVWLGRRWQLARRPGDVTSFLRDADRRARAGRHRPRPIPPNPSSPHPSHLVYLAPIRPWAGAAWRTGQRRPAGRRRAGGGGRTAATIAPRLGGLQAHGRLLLRKLGQGGLRWLLVCARKCLVKAAWQDSCSLRFPERECVASKSKEANEDVFNSCSCALVTYTPRPPQHAC